MFLSQLDVKVARSGFLDLPFQDNDSVIVDKVFTFQDLLPLGISFKIPPLIGSSRQMPTEDVVKTQEIASIGIHLERGINKIKIFHIWDGVIPLPAVWPCKPNVVSVCNIVQCSTHNISIYYCKLSQKIMY